MEILNKLENYTISFEIYLMLQFIRNFLQCTSSFNAHRRISLNESHRISFRIPLFEPVCCGHPNGTAANDENIRFFWNHRSWFFPTIFCKALELLADQLFWAFVGSNVRLGRLRTLPVAIVTHRRRSTLCITKSDPTGNIAKDISHSLHHCQGMIDMVMGGGRPKEKMSITLSSSHQGTQPCRIFNL